MSILHMLKSATDTICESFVFQDGETLLVVDGGFESESEILYEKLALLGGVVTGWFFTHAHDDHIGAFCRLMADHGDRIRVKALYLNFPEDELLVRYEPTCEKETRKYLPWIRELAEKHGITMITMRRGNVYSFGGALIHVLREPQNDITQNFINNSSVVFRLDVNGKRVLFLGDLGEAGGRHLLDTTAAGELRSDYVQMAHHGQKGVAREVYEAVKADCCLWCTPTWLWDNMGQDGYDTGNFKTVVVRGWISEIRARKHYVGMNGPFEIEL